MESGGDTHICGAVVLEEVALMSGRCCRLPLIRANITSHLAPQQFHTGFVASWDVTALFLGLEWRGIHMEIMRSGPVGSVSKKRKDMETPPPASVSSASDWHLPVLGAPCPA